MSDRVTYRDMAIMEEVLDQGDKQVCWAISLTRQLAALLKLRGQLNINARLSIQYLINKVGRSLFGAQTPRPWSGSVRSFETAIPFLVNGTVLENLVPLRNFDLQSSTPENHVLGERRYRAVRIVVHRINEYPDQAAFEADLVRCLRQSPVAAAIKVYPSYGRIAGNEIYMQRTYERDEVTPLKHSMLLVKSGRDQFGTPYWEFQDSSGETKGRGGYVRIRKGVGLLTEFVEMFLVEEEPPKKKRKAVSVDASHKRPKNVHNRLSLGPGKHSKSHKLSQGRSRSSSTSTSRKAGSSVRTISPKSPVPSASAFENMDASYLQTSGYLPADATEEQISMAAASMIRSHSMSGDLQPDPIAPKEELFPGNIITVTELNKKNPLNYAQVSVLADDILKNLEFDALHNKFHSVLSPEIIPKESEVGGKLGELDSCKIEAGETKGEVLQNLAEFLFSCVMFNAVLENACSEMGAGMSAMDRSSRNAGEMLDRLTLAYNRTLHASMPIETISGA